MEELNLEVALIELMHLNTRSINQTSPESKPHQKNSHLLCLFPRLNIQHTCNLVFSRVDNNRSHGCNLHC